MSPVCLGCICPTGEPRIRPAGTEGFDDISFEAAVPVLVAHAATGASSTDVRDVVMLTGTPAPDARLWAETMAAALGGTVREGPRIEQCTPSGIEPSTIVTVALPLSASGRHVHASIAALARTCPVPVLFVPVAAVEAAL